MQTGRNDEGTAARRPEDGRRRPFRVLLVKPYRPASNLSIVPSLGLLRERRTGRFPAGREIPA